MWLGQSWDSLEMEVVLTDAWVGGYGYFTSGVTELVVRVNDGGGFRSS